MANVCANYLLTKTGRCDIMVNSTRLDRGRGAKSQLVKLHKNVNRTHISVRPTHKEKGGKREKW
jgi:hypothetical protein